MSPPTAHSRPPTGATLPDYLDAGLEVVFVGLNPSLKSAQVGHYYAGPGNQFWPFLYEAGFTDQKLTPEDDASILEHSIGLTDIVKRSTRGVNDLARREFAPGLDGLRQKLVKYRPRMVAFNGKTGYQNAVGHRIEYGLQSDALEGIPVFVCPSTSGAFPMPREEKLKYFREVRRLSLQTIAKLREP